MKHLSALLKKYNCIWVRVEIGDRLTLCVKGDYDVKDFPKDRILLSEIVYADDFPTLMDTLNDFATNGELRMYTHFRMETEKELHWAYLCCEKSDRNDGGYNGVLLDVYEYLDCIPNDRVISEFEKRQKERIESLERDPATLFDICGGEYLRKIQLPFLITGVASAIYNERGKLICSLPEQRNVEKSGYRYIKKMPIRFNRAIGGWWCVGTNSEENVGVAEIMLETMTDNLSRIAQTAILLSNEMENSRAVNLQLGANVEQQMLLNRLYSIIMEESDSEKALAQVLELSVKSLRVDRIAAYLPSGEAREPTLICHYENELGKSSHLDLYVPEHYREILTRMDMAEHYFAHGSGEIPTAMTTFAVSKISGGKNGLGLLFYEIYGEPRQWDYGDRRMIRNISQAISGFALRREMDREIEEKNRQLTRLAYSDTMLGIKNRARLDLDTAEALSAEKSGIGMAVQILNTRSLNEVFGQSYTDRLLRMIADELTHPDVGGDAVYRYSGSIFFLLLTEMEADEAKRIAHSILARFSEPFRIDGAEQYAEAAVGIAAFGPAITKSEDLYRAALLSLYRANEYGKNSLAFVNHEFLETTGSTYHLEQELRRCIADHMRGFELNYQPVYHGETIHHYEALLRWHGERDGKLSPRVFMRLMEKVGLDSAIDFWVIPEACRFCRRMRERTGEAVRVSVNLTIREMQSGAIPGAIHNALRETELSPDALIVEVPEGAHVHAPTETAATLGRIKKMGVSVCIDSFGNEYLPLSALKYSYIDMIKIGASFITNSGDDFDAELVKTTVRLAESRGIDVFVKNVEYLAQLETARGFGLERFQGGLFAPPYPEEEFVEKLAVRVAAEKETEEE
ncbi:MAG: bifunctional diguanylate cyclase/phosphodiesterase [Bacteroides sp.]|nr:bifunctional diguanylate cyclase/phosphodiesterase [Eubacterium sp.]MCM1419595.1 bifunctional diguanylate cyclase/phosphodiesterase [Roseburia sp.]MCM1463558.1 bifunctional diguanylate cyclase/phosphodiesterase [Bacteroides sp.]